MATSKIALDTFLENLAQSIQAVDAPARVKSVLEKQLQNGLDLPERFHQTSPHNYSRHLLARFESGATAIVMAWGPGQGTPLHDHAGLWCVEGVVQGRIKVTRYHLSSEQGDLKKFSKGEEILAGMGSAGALIPPVDHHTIANDGEEPSLTLHVYAGEMEECQVFLPVGDGYYREECRTLSYTTCDPLISCAAAQERPSGSID